MAYKNKEDARRWYAENREAEISKAIVNKARYIERNVNYVNSIKSDAKCTDCNESFNCLEVLDFDHLGDKRANISNLARKPVSLEKLQAEIDKCEIVCANCHRVRTVMRRGIA